MLRHFLRQRRRASSLAAATRPSVRLQLQTLEDRCLLSTWTPLSNMPADYVGTMMLLPNGTVMAQGQGNNGVSNTWYQLTPDATGNYAKGTWSQLASMSLERLYYASNVLPSDNVLVLGGEYSGPNGNQNLTNTGEIYDALTNTWSATANFPQTKFGDDPSALLSNGQVLCGYVLGAATYLYDPGSNTWSQTGTKLYSDRSDEEGFVSLPDGSVLSYDVFSSVSNGTFQAQRYVLSTGAWVDASNLDSNNPPSLLSSSSVGY